MRRREGESRSEGKNEWEGRERVRRREGESRSEGKNEWEGRDREREGHAGSPAVHSVTEAFLT